MLKKALLIIFCVFSLQAHAEELTDEKRKIIDEIFEITRGLEIADFVEAKMSQQLIRTLSQQEEIDPKVVEILKEESRKIIHDEFIANGWLSDIAYEIYHERFSLSDLQKMVAFYKTTTGRKVIELMPEIIKEAMRKNQCHIASLGPVLMERLRARFEQEGIKFSLEEDTKLRKL